MDLINVEGSKVGTFSITRKILLSHQKFVQEIMGRCIIIRAENMFNFDGIEYQALSEEFERVAQGKAIPEYWIDVWIEEAKVVKWRFRKKGTGEDLPVLREIGGEVNAPKDDARSEED